MIPPLCDADAEEAVLGVLVTRPDRLPEVRHLRPEHFFVDSHREIYRALLSLHGQGQPIDAVAIATELRQTGKLDRIGGTEPIGRVITAPWVTHLRPHADTIVEYWRRRQLRHLCAEVAGELEGGTLSADDAIERLAGVCP